MNHLKLSNLADFLAQVNAIDAKILSDEIVSKVEEIHKTKSDKKDWPEEYSHFLNISQYEYGLLTNKGLRDYLLVDYINKNKYIINNRIKSQLIKNSILLNKSILESKDVSYEKSDNFGDKIIDYLDLNVIAYYNKELAKNIINKANKDNSIKFYKLFTFYTCKYTLDMIRKKESVKDKEYKKEYEKIIDFIFDSYEDFTENRPNWA